MTENTVDLLAAIGIPLPRGICNACLADNSAAQGDPATGANRNEVEYSGDEANARK